MEAKVDAVGVGFPVHFSSVYNTDYEKLYRLDSPEIPGVACAWSTKHQRTGDFVIISSMKRQEWTDIITQGRGDADHWVTGYTIQYSDDGMNWTHYNYGTTIEGNSDRNTKKMHTFTAPIVARAIEITIAKYHGHPSMRFGALFRADAEN